MVAKGLPVFRPRVFGEHLCLIRDKISDWRKDIDQLVAENCRSQKQYIAYMLGGDVRELVSNGLGLKGSSALHFAQIRQSPTKIRKAAAKLIAI
jgi:hypothetical protein